MLITAVCCLVLHDFVCLSFFKIKGVFKKFSFKNPGNSLKLCAAMCYGCDRKLKCHPYDCGDSEVTSFCSKRVIWCRKTEKWEVTFLFSMLQCTAYIVMLFWPITESRRCQSFDRRKSWKGNSEMLAETRNRKWITLPFFVQAAASEVGPKVYAILYTAYCILYVPRKH